MEIPPQDSHLSLTKDSGASGKSRNPPRALMTTLRRQNVKWMRAFCCHLAPADLLPVASAESNGRQRWRLQRQTGGWIEDGRRREKINEEDRLIPFPFSERHFFRFVSCMPFVHHLREKYISGI